MRTKTLFLGALVAVFLSGCAVLTVDVDVYTGPLSNTEEVQTDQVISLVMGAKPLLVQLRDHLEVGSYAAYPVQTGKGASDLVARPRSLQAELARFREQAWYWPGFIASLGSTGPRLQNEHALRVNDILVLYDDRTPEVFASLIARGSEMYLRYQASYDILFPPDASENHRLDKKAWDAIECGILKTNKQGAAACELFLVSQNGRRVSGPLLSWLRSLKAQTPANAPPQAPTNAPPQAVAKHPASNDCAGSFAQLDAETIERIRTDCLIKAAVTSLFGSNRVESDAAKQFLRQTDRLFNAYDEARAALHDLALLSLRGLREVGTARFASPQDSNYVARAVAAFAATLITPSTNWASVNKSSAMLRPVTKLLVVRLLEQPKTFRAQLEAQMLADPAKTADALLALDAELANSRANLTSGGASLEQMRLPGDLKEELLFLEQAAGSALDSGRDPKGLETLIDDYLEAAAKTRGTQTSFNARVQTPEFARLMNALIAYGQKIVTLGNTDILIQTGNSSEAQKYIGVLQYIGNTILVHVDELKRRAQFQAAQEDKADAAVKALQQGGFTKQLPTSWAKELKAKRVRYTTKDAVEQLLLVLRAEYAHALHEGAGPVTATTITSGTVLGGAAADKAASLSNQLTLTVTGTNLTSRSRGATARAASAPAKDETKLSLSLTNQVQVPGPAEKILQSIQAVTEMRQGMIYLRPATAYLRSSYPATTLNVNESVGWQNQLERQAWRAIPGIGHIVDRAGAGRLKELRELDKQSWQNVNRIRLAGAGRANYVLAKDDVGNWYVKQYAADPSNIIHSAKNLALFSAGSAFGQPLSLLSSSETDRVTAGSPFNAQFAKAAANYLTQTTNSWHRLTNALQGGAFTNEIASAWTLAGFTGSNLDTLAQTAFAPAVHKKLDDAINAGHAKLKQASDEALARSADAAILDVLGALKRYHDTVRPKLNLGDNSRLARQTFTTELRHLLDDAIAERTSALDRFAAAIEVIQTGTSK